MVVQQSLSPQTGVDTGGGLTFDKGKSVKVPNHLALCVFDLSLGCCNEAAFGVFKRRGVGIIVLLRQGLVGLLRPHAAPLLTGRFSLMARTTAEQHAQQSAHQA